MSDKPSWFSSVPKNGVIFLVGIAAILLAYGVIGVLTS